MHPIDTATADEYRVQSEVLVIRPNEQAVDIEADWTPRSAHEPVPHHASYDPQGASGEGAALVAAGVDPGPAWCPVG